MGNSLRNDKRVSCKRYSIVGVNDDEGPPVPIPNTVVKLIGVDNTWREAAREDRSMPTLFNRSSFGGRLYALIAQSVEHAAVNRGVVGSSPTGGASLIPYAVTSVTAYVNQKLSVWAFSSVG